MENSLGEISPFSEIKNLALCEVQEDSCLNNMEYSIGSLRQKSNSTVSQFNLNACAQPFMPNTSTNNCDSSPSNICDDNYALNDALLTPSVLNLPNDFNVTTECEEDLEILNKIRTKNLNNVVIGLLNVNSFNAKFDSIRSIVIDKIDILVLVETKLDDTYPTSQFIMGGYSSPFRRDRNRYGGGILIYVREDIPCKILHNHNLPEDIEGIFLELNFRKSKSQNMINMFSRRFQC